MEYCIEDSRKGYIVYAVALGMSPMPLRNFGDMQSAAMEFRDYCKSHVDDEQALRYARSYEEGTLYTYPVIKNGRAELRRQRPK